MIGQTISHYRIVEKLGGGESIFEFVLRVISVLVGGLCLFPVAFGASAQLAGHWEGTMVRDGVSLKSALTSVHRGRNPRAPSLP